MTTEMVILLSRISTLSIANKSFKIRGACQGGKFGRALVKCSPSSVQSTSLFQPKSTSTQNFANVKSKHQNCFNQQWFFFRNCKGLGSTNAT